MRVAVYYNNRDVRLKEMPTPQIGPGEILVKVLASGICGTDVMEWYRIKKAPRILGHEITGEVVESKSEKYKIGQRVFVSHHVPCNKCNYCLAAHTALGKMVGFSEEETLDLRTGSIEDQQLRALTTLAREITVHKGHPNEKYLENFFEVGYGKQALVELIGLVAFKTFSNYLNNMTEVVVDFPKAKELKKAA